ncbi:MAG: glycosyltransferase [candidate division WOR-3 bacterium]
MLSIIIINFRMLEKVIRCIKSIFKTQDMSGMEIIVVNKSSGDNAGMVIKKIFQFVKIIECRKFGVAYMRNIGIKRARGDYLLLLDADTILLEDLRPAIDFIKKNPDCAALGVKLISPDGELQFSCRTFYDLKTIIFRRTPLKGIFPNSAIIKRHLMMDFDHQSSIAVDWIQGAFFLINRKALKEIGLFDEFSPFGFEDTAWCYRAYKKNWKIYYYPYITVIHEFQRSSASFFSRQAFYHFLAFLKFYLRYRLLGQ